jgi:hypothetical protein
MNRLLRWLPNWRLGLRPLRNFGVNWPSWRLLNRRPLRNFWVNWP